MDVAVAGVGIAGAFALRALDKSLDVVGIDKREKLGYPVECGEIIPTKREMKVLLPDLEDYSLFDIPKRFESNLTKEVHFVLPNGKTFEIDFEFHVVRRDEMIQTIAEESGHKLLLKKRIKAFRDGKIVLEEGEVEAEVYVASDGPNSKIARSLGMPKPEVSPAKQYVMEGVECDEDVVYMYIGRKISPGAYAWIIPKGKGVANVGIGFRPEYASRGDTIVKALDHFVREYPHSSPFLKDAEVVSSIGAVVPIDRPFESAVKGNVLFAGDAASMVISHVGGGIPTAMVAGDAAARVINGFFNGENDLQLYDSLWKKYLYKPLTNAYTIKRIWDRFSDSDEKVSRLLGLASNADMNKILRCRIPLKIKLLSPFLPIVQKLI
ncbi:MAG: Bacteriochlorophyll synthase, 43 kDa subunit (ChlP-3) [Archaeoglobus fulgidus]|uniref:Bacteriochlorophyll synthase, 43 kDa subunit (ChlP-3) n=1 Tax=Archaeoglobus fulgidus TaxID=2234 RepID=A0A101DCG7_ARCFL|nr:geranylgeranyl reductase family protein [Archaeoglobus fulgidus]KUJ93021.1 MAG: Bacteriochlorophyll synthase, 43 kDa subunit (ChlP-3) [Archaeoglobus fulgidus]